MKIKRVGIEAKKVMQQLGVDKPGIKIMAKKSEVMLFLIKDLHVGAANILKQDALSIGADFAVPNGTITCAFKRVDGLLIGTRKHIELLAKKEMAQPYGLKEVAKRLREYLGQKRFEVKIMGVINANSDSFYPASRFSSKSAIEAIEKMIEDGADMIDIGGVSSRPGSEEVSEVEELRRVRDIIDTIYSQKLYERVDFSIDSYRSKVIEYALSRGFKIANDITGLEDDEVARVVVKYDAKVVIMHKKGSPKTMQLSPYYEDVTIEVSEFFEKRLQKAKEFGIDEVILDPGIGFGKSLEHNIELLKNLKEFSRFGCEILVGASRKSMIDMITPTPVEKRLPGTLAIHIKALENGASIIRCHDVAEHKQAIEVFKRL